jgi:hypothetical protein
MEFKKVNAILKNTYFYKMQDDTILLNNTLNDDDDTLRDYSDESTDTDSDTLDNTLTLQKIPHIPEHMSSKIINMYNLRIAQFAQQRGDIILQEMYINSDFWKLIKQIEWLNKSEGLCGIKNMQKLSASQKYALSERIIFLQSKLHTLLQNNVLMFADLSEIIKLDVAYHIIAKGKDFYELCISDYSWVKYIIEGNEYQRLFCYL